MMSKLTVTCRGFYPLHRNTLRGFCEIRINELRLVIRDIAIHEKGEDRWAQLTASWSTMPMAKSNTSTS